MIDVNVLLLCYVCVDGAATDSTGGLYGCMDAMGAVGAVDAVGVYLGAVQAC